ncbi:hypothetical protein D3C84_1115180 [compost metagenome]
MHQAPAAVHGLACQQPFNRTLTEGRNTVVDFFGLLGDMNVDRRLAVIGFQAIEQRR